MVCIRRLEQAAGPGVDVRSDISAGKPFRCVSLQRRRQDTRAEPFLNAGLHSQLWLQYSREDVPSYSSSEQNRSIRVLNPFRALEHMTAQRDVLLELLNVTSNGFEIRVGRCCQQARHVQLIDVSQIICKIMRF